MNYTSYEINLRYHNYIQSTLSTFVYTFNYIQQEHSEIRLIHDRVPSGLLTNIFGTWALWFNSTWSDQFICHQSCTTCQIVFYIRVSLSVFIRIQRLLPSTGIYYIRHNIFYSIKFYKESTTNFSRKQKNPQNSTTNFPQAVWQK